MLLVEDFKRTHYPMLKQWWEEHNFPPPPMSILPKNGCVVKDKETGIYLYAMFMYLSDSPIAWIEFIVDNPNLNRKESVLLKRGALKEGIYYLQEKSKRLRNKPKVFFTTTNNPALVNSLKKSNFDVGDTNMYQLIKHI